MADPTLDPNGAYAQALQTSPNFINPSYATPEQIAQLRAISGGLMQNQPVHNWAEGLGSLAQYAAGLYLNSKANDQQRQAINYQIQQGIPRDANGNPLSGGMLGSPPPSGAAPAGSDVGGTQGNKGFIDPVKAASYYTANGLSPVQAAGLVGTLAGESDLNPNAIRHHDGRDGSDSIGIMQANADRGRNLAAYAQKYGKPVNDPQINLDFPLVEMGLKGNTSDPGFGTQIAAGRGLKAAQTPQQAAIAAVGYERPQGWTPQNPMAASGMAKRMAVTNALVGGGMQPQQAQPTQVAQAGPPQGAGPLGGMGAAQISAILANPWVDEHTKKTIREMYTPQIVGVPGGGAAGVVTGQGMTATPSVAGVLQSNVSPGSVPVNASVGPQGVTGNTLGVPPAGSNGKVLGGVAPVMKEMQAIGAAGQEQEGLVHKLGTLRDQGVDSKAALGQIDTLEKLGDQVNDSGFVPMIQSAAAAHGIQIGSNVPAIQAYEAYANSMLPKPGVGGLLNIPAFQAATGSLATTPEGRHIIANNMRMVHQYNTQVADIASQYEKSPQERWQEIQAIPVPKPVTALPSQQGGQQTAGGATPPARGASVQAPPAAAQAAPAATSGAGAGAPAAATAVALPKVGEVRRGWKYKGGDPSQSSNWAKVAP